MWRQVVLGVICLFFASPAMVQANVDVATSFDAQYDIQTDGQTRVRYLIRLRNTTSRIFATQYALRLQTEDVSELSVQDEHGVNLAHTLQETPEGFNVTVTFPVDKKVIGRDKEQVFSLAYTTSSVAAAYGQVLEATVPKLADPQQYVQYNVIVTVPEHFGEPSLIMPNRYTLDTASGQHVVRFTNVGQETGITLVFGTQQSYGMQLRYHVKNPAQNTGVVEVALPPDTSWQRVYWESIVPLPKNIRRDDDGNWVATFTLAGEAEQVVVANGTVTLFAQPQEEPHLARALQKKALPWWQQSGSPWLRATTYWPAEHATFQQLAQQHASPRSMYDYVVNTLHYNYKRFEQENSTQRLGALGALQDPSNAVCQEYTDLFVALARAGGVPARRIIGYGMTRNSRLRPLSLVADVLHTWPEYFDTQRQIWVPIDPTWGDTTGGVDYFSQLDFRHVAFAIQGVNDDRPLAAGMYKSAAEPTKDITMTVLPQPVAHPLQPVLVALEPGWLPQFGLPTKLRFIVKNPDGGARYTIPVAFGVSPGLKVLGHNTVTLEHLLPYQSQELTLDVSGEDWWRATNGTVTVYVNDTAYEFAISARRAFLAPQYRWVVMGGGLAAVSLGAGSVLVFVLQRIGHVRRKSKKSQKSH